MNRKLTDQERQLGEYISLMNWYCYSVGVFLVITVVLYLFDKRTAAALVFPVCIASNLIAIHYARKARAIEDELDRLQP